MNIFFEESLKYPMFGLKPEQSIMNLLLMFNPAILKKNIASDGNHIESDDDKNMLIFNCRFD